VNLPESIYARLSADSGVTAIASTRIRPISSAQVQGDMSPTVLYRQIGRADEESLNWRPMPITRWEVVGVAQGYDAAYSLGRAIEAALNGFGTDGNNELGGSGGVRCKIRLLDQFDEEVPEIGIYGLIGEYEITEEV